MKQLQLLGLLAIGFLAGCGPQVSGPGSEPPSDPATEVIDEALEAKANTASEAE
jgi:hypothetical protein